MTASEERKKMQSERPGGFTADRTPAMAAGLVDHIWSVEELLLFPISG